MKNIILFALLLACISTTLCAQSPVLFFSDLISGPNTGGQGGNGAYVSVYGNFFGASQGSSTITVGGGAMTNCVIWGVSHLWYQQITCQLGASAATGNIVVTVNGLASNTLPFAVASGNIYFVATTGSDGAAGSYAAPWATLLKARNSMANGDITYALNGVTQSTDDGTGWDAAFLLSGGGQGNWCSATGNPRALVAYPGATVTIGSPTGASDPSWGLRASDCQGNWVLAGISFRGISPVEVGDSPSVGGYRFIGSDITCPYTSGSAGGGSCFETSQASNIFFYGNHVYNAGTAGASALFQGVYFSTDSNDIDMGWNLVENVHGCRGVQVHSSPLGSGGSSDPTGHDQYDISIHDNTIHDTQCDGIIVDTVDPSQGPVTVYNNVVYNAGKGPANPEDTGGWNCINIPASTENGPNGSGTIEIFGNTMHSCGTFTTPPYGSDNNGFAYNGDEPVGAPVIAAHLRNNIIDAVPTTLFPLGVPYLVVWDPTTDEPCTDLQICSWVYGTNNLMYGTGAPVLNLTEITGTVNAVPAFVSPATADFHIGPASGAQNAGIALGSPSVYGANNTLRDHDGLLRPTVPAIGAYEVPAITNVTVTPLPQQLIINYNTTTGGVCTVLASLNATNGVPTAPYVNDISAALFTGSSSDNRPGSLSSGTQRTFVLGARTAQLANAAGSDTYRHYSRSLQPLRTYYVSVTCGSSVAYTVGTTSNISLGETYGEPYLVDPNNPGTQPLPEALGNGTAETYNDPQQGTVNYAVGTRGNKWGAWANFAMDSAFNQAHIGTPCDTGGAWTTPCNVVGTSGYATAGDTSSVLVVRPPLTNAAGPWNAGYGGSGYGNTAWSIDQLSFAITAYVSATGFPTLNACLSLNGGQSCATATQQATLTTTPTTYTFGSYNTANLGVLPWLLDSNPRFNTFESAPHYGSGTITLSGGVYTLTNQSNPSCQAGSDCFSLYWINGGNGSMRISSSGTACIDPPASTTSTEYQIASFTNGNAVTLSGTPPTGTVNWCENNFGVMLWRSGPPTDSSTIYLQHAEMSVLESGFPYYPDNGTGGACMNTLTSNGLSGASAGMGYWCGYGGVMWVDPGNPALSAYFAYTGTSSSGPNPWTGFSYPTGNSADIDQTQAQFTFDNLANDSSSGSPLVIQGVFNPSNATAPFTAGVISQPTIAQGGNSQIQNATQNSPTTYSVTYNNGLAFTNLTPQTTMAESVFDQVAALDGTFQASYYNANPIGGGGANCFNGGVSLGIYAFGCFVYGGDSPGIIVAFDPGDYNPAHAGLSSGPRIVGEITTYNTPQGAVATGQGALVGFSLHALSQTGETGWFQIDCNPYSPITTTTLTGSGIPSTGPAKCNTFDATLSSVADCIAIQMNSYTYASVTGYEPYYTAGSILKGTPGELRTTQIGDTACIVGGSGSCSFTGGNELLTLRIKNYTSPGIFTTPGNFVFQRATYGTETAIAAGTATLDWQSYQSSLPIGAETANTGITVFWNPLTGCGGAPDPLGNCFLQDTNNTQSHGYWSNGSEAVNTNCPAWQEAIWGWPSCYQTVLGYIPGILSFPFANITPYQAAGVNFAAVNPPFSATYGHPWGFDGGSHPNPPGANSSPHEITQGFDNLPIQGGQNEQAFTLVSGQLYSMTPANVTDPDDIQGTGSYVPINRKLMATAVSCGSHPLVDVSGPSSSINGTAGASYEYCFARNVNECQSGSTVGEVFVNCPGVTAPSCGGSGIHGSNPLGVGNDICMGNVALNGDSIMQFGLGATDHQGAYSRSLSLSEQWFHMVYGFENNQSTPGNEALLYRREFPEYQRADMWELTLPPYPAFDSVNRAAYEPIAIKVSPGPTSIATRAAVDFGYMEYAQGGTYNCTTRNDGCQSVTAAIPTGNTPFVFVSESATGLACTSGCTITVPAIPARAMYYRIRYENSSSVTIALGPWQLTAIP